MAYSSKLQRGFSTKQQGHYRPMVEAAWKRACQLDATLLQGADKAATKRVWYENELEVATGKRSTLDLDRKRDFTAAMAHFETIVGESIYWNMRLYGDDARRVAFNLREICRESDVDEDYMRSMARRMLRLSPTQPLPELGQMSYQQLIIIMGELKRFLRRGGRPHVKQEALPF
jgi:hypothetical protein